MTFFENDRRRWIKQTIRVTPEQGARLYIHHMQMAASMFMTFGSDADEIFQSELSKLGDELDEELTRCMAKAAHAAGVRFCAEAAEDVL